MIFFIKWETWDDAKQDLCEIFEMDLVKHLEYTIQFAEKYHGDQKRVNGEPIIKHLLQVLEILILEMGIKDKPILTASILHDILEDTSVIENEIIDLFGKEVFNIVKTLTKPKVTQSQNKQTLKIDYLKSLKNAPSNVLIIKLADRYSNVQRLSIDPSYDRQKSYYKQTVDYIIPLCNNFPKFRTLFNSWQEFYSFLSN
ncbi:MAG: HD domain-containing protein [Anaerolineaceae bacterium]|nr:HD domain-containing protein [Anaerolineaceae bacterium]